MNKKLEEEIDKESGIIGPKSVMLSIDLEEFKIPIHHGFLQLYEEVDRIARYSIKDLQFTGYHVVKVTIKPDSEFVLQLIITAGKLPEADLRSFHSRLGDMFLINELEAVK